MKYVISDLGEITIGNDFHFNLARGFLGKVVRAGHCHLKEGIYEVFGESIGYGIKAKDEDAKILSDKKL